MISFKAIAAIFLSAMIGSAQTINIRGIVKDRAGVGIPGATVRLEAAGISATAGPDGTFSFANVSKPLPQSDVISIIKEGQLNYRDSIKLSDAFDIVVKMVPNAGNVTDRDGNVYQSVQIGNQVWTVENLMTTKYNDGTAIPEVTDAEKWSLLTTGACCFYNNNAAANNAKYGALYNWYAVGTGKLAPQGWRVPTDAEWATLQKYLIANGYNWDGTTTGNRIAKSIAAPTDWYSSPYAGSPGNDLSKNNASGFSALPAGYRNLDGGFYFQGKNICWWGATDSVATSAFSRFLYCSTEFLVRPHDLKRYGFSVRLVRD